VKAKVFLPIIIISFTVALAFHFIALAAIDAPHNEANIVSCGRCHGEGLLQSFWGGSGIYSTVDELCLSCHTQLSCPLPSDTIGLYAKTHIDSGDVVLAECIICHDPHYQKQRDYKNTDWSNLYLAYGTIINCSYNPPVPPDTVGTSTLTYASIVYKTETGWDAARLIGKTESCSRTILFPNVKKLGYSYPVVAVDEGANTITVKGDATKAYEYVSPPTDFAVLYGQFIREEINGNPVKFFDPEGVGSFADGNGTYNGVCEVCHTQTMYHRNNGTDARHFATSKCIPCHTHINGLVNSGGEGPSHSTHVDDGKGPHSTCSECHDTTMFPYFKSGTDVNEDGVYELSETDVCDTCHSPGGAFDGVNNAVIGAKNVWATGAYDTYGKLRDGLENWCLGCHDDNPNTAFPTNESAYIGGVYAPNIAGDENNGNNYGFNLTGHGMGSTFSTKVDCTSCHDSSKTHVDGESRTYFATSSPNNYVAGYRLAGLMTVPAPGFSGGRKGFIYAKLCFDCHDPDLLGTYQGDTSQSHTNFQDGTQNLHYVHFLVGSCDSDFDGTGDTGASGSICIICHNVHGATNSAMIRHGELISTPGTTDKVPALNFTYVTAGGNDPYAALEDTIGGDMQYGGGGFERNKVCRDCHTLQYYARTPNLAPWVLIPRATPASVLPGVATDVLLTATVVDPDDNINTVEIDLSNVGGSSNQTMYDDATHGDVIANDGVFSFQTNVSLAVGVYENKITATDLTVLTGGNDISLDVMGANDRIVDNAYATFVGSWKPWYGGYGRAFMYKDAGSGSSTATYTPDLPMAGTYRVYASWVAHSNRATDAPYTIYYDGGSVTIFVNQQMNGDPWKLLGTYVFAAGNSAYVVLSDDASGYVIADAIKFEYSGDSAYYISGQITEDSVGLDGIAVQLSGDRTVSTVTAGGGYYSFLAIDGSYIITPSSIIYDFMPTSKNVTVSGADQTGQDFTAVALVTHDISGQITEDSVGLDGIAVQLSGDRTGSTVTVGGGYYTLSVPDGNYSVTPTSSIYEFTPASNNVTVSGADQPNQNFTASISDIIIDDLDAAFYGNWTNYSGPTQYGTSYRYHAVATAVQTATWVPDLPKAGVYRVYAWWVAHSNRATDAPYIIYYNGGSQEVRVNQQTNGGQWNQLGTFDFAAGASGYIVLNADADGYVIADAIRFELVP
jgi:hypothetical protein